jgi:hypothetical protein
MSFFAALEPARRHIFEIEEARVSSAVGRNYPTQAAGAAGKQIGGIA